MDLYMEAHTEQWQQLLWYWCDSDTSYVYFISVHVQGSAPEMVNMSFYLAQPRSLGYIILPLLSSPFVTRRQILFQKTQKEARWKTKKKDQEECVVQDEGKAVVMVLLLFDQSVAFLISISTRYQVTQILPWWKPKKKGDQKMSLSYFTHLKSVCVKIFKVLVYRYPNLYIHILYVFLLDSALNHVTVLEMKSCQPNTWNKVNHCYQLQWKVWTMCELFKRDVRTSMPKGWSDTTAMSGLSALNGVLRCTSWLELVNDSERWWKLWLNFTKQDIQYWL